jgi:hypothetical protein
MHLHDSIVDAEQPEYAHAVLTAELDLQPAARHEVLKLASQFSAYGRIVGVNIVGSLLTKNYTDTSDLDVNIELVAYEERVGLENARRFAFAQADSVFLPGTKHPVNFFVEPVLDPEKHDAIYDVLRDKWAKQVKVKPVNIEHYWGVFQDFVKTINADKAELIDDVLKFDELLELDDVSRSELTKRLEAQLEEIDADVKKLAGTYGVLHGLRRSSFSKEMSVAEIKQYQIKNKLPANVLYKLLQRYSYIQFLQRVKQVLKAAGGSIDTEQDVELVKTAIGVEEAIDELVEASKRVDGYRGAVNPKSLISRAMPARGDQEHVDLFPHNELTGDNRWSYAKGSSVIHWWFTPPTGYKDSAVDCLRSMGVDVNSITHRVMINRAFQESSSTEGGPKWDRVRGMGAVPNQQTIDYFGFTKEMSPDRFLSLVPPRDADEGTERVLAGVKSGKPVGPPFLQVKWEAKGKQWQVYDHEGRGRCKAVREIYGNIMIPVDIFPSGMRARDLTPEMINAPFRAQPTESVESIIDEMTGAGAAGGYDMPLGATPYWKRRKRRKLRK